MTLPEIAVTDKVDLRFFNAIQESVERMIQTQMDAYPSVWSDADRREMAELYFSKGGVK